MMDILIAILALLSFSFAGISLLKWMGFHGKSFAEVFLSGFGLMIGISGTLTFLLGIVGILSKITVIICIALIAFLATFSIRNVPEIIRSFRNIVFKENDIFTYTLLALSFFFVLLNVSLAYMPVSAPDALNYHITLPKLYLINNAIDDHLKGYLYSYLPQLAEMINLIFLSISSPEAASVFNSFYAISCFFLIYLIAEPYLSSKTRLLASALFLTMPMVTWLSTGLFVELQLTFFFLLSVLFMRTYSREGKLLNLTLSGVFLGFALQTKVLGFVMLASMFTISVVFFLHDKSPRLRVRFILIWSCTALVLGSPWYLYAFIKTGNPVFPFLWNFLGGDSWNAGSSEAIKTWLSTYGYGRSFLSYVSLPYNLLFRGGNFDQAEILSPLVIILCPFGLLARRYRKIVIAIIGLAVIYISAWFFMTQQARFLTPIVALLTIPACIGISYIVARKTLFSLCLKAIILTAIIINIMYCLSYAKRYLPILGNDGENRFLSDTVRGYPYLKWMNDFLDEKDKVLFFGNGMYYLDIPFYPGKQAFQGLIDYTALDSADELHEKLVDMNISHIYVWGKYLPDNAIDVSLWNDFKNKYLSMLAYDMKKVKSQGGNIYIDLRNSGIVYKMR